MSKYIEKLKQEKREPSAFVKRYADSFESIKTIEEKQLLIKALHEAEMWGK